MKCLWLDIGNTRLKYWITHHEHTLAHAAELHLQSPADLLLGLIEFFKTQQLQQVGISSVLDQQNNQRIMQILTALNIPIVVACVTANHAGLRCGYDQPQQLGVDRWLQVLAVTQPHQQFCVIGCGTALTIDLVDGLHHLGGYILPSLYLQRDALIKGTKGIKINDSAFNDLKPARNTTDAVHQGILLGLVSAIEHILQRNQGSWQLILTGGDAALFAAFLQDYQPRIEPDLLLKGLQRYVSTDSPLGF